jgi:flagellum-specific peptidoglycan hydrolase FlgJ
MGYSSSQAKDFIKHIAPIICKEADDHGYKIKSTVIAQAIIEGAAGTSSLAKRWHNHFGMKCGSSWKGKSVNLSTKEEYTPGQLTNIKANFRAYDSDEEGIAGYYDFINTKRYANLKNAKDYRQYAEYIKADGWATSSTYVNTLISTVKKYNLFTYDTWDVNTIKPIDEIVKEIIDGKWGNGNDRRQRLERAGYDYDEIQKAVNKTIKERS